MRAAVPEVAASILVFVLFAGLVPVVAHELPISTGLFYALIGIGAALVQALSVDGCVSLLAWLLGPSRRLQVGGAKA